MTVTENGTTHLRQLAGWLDDRFVIPGTEIRIGLDPLIGFIPGIGDWLGGMIALYFIGWGAAYGIPPAVFGRMFLNILLDVVIGSIPFLGDLFDVGWKSNLKNAKLLEKYVHNAGEVQRHSRMLLWALFLISMVIILGLIVAIIWGMAEIVKLLF